VFALIEKIPRPFFLFLGRLSPEKGADLFVALARKNPQSGFVMAGGGPLLEGLKQNCPSNLVFAGFVSDSEKAWLYENTAALVISSRVPENSPMVIFESHPYNTPIVFPPDGGAEEIVKYLGRAGCSLRQFNGQEFTKSHLQSGDFQDDFERKIAALFQ
jgi:glycosyltransferase involved in cell wall biosynthesis